MRSIDNRNKDEEELPIGWSEVFTPEGKAYYQNNVTKITQWNRPTTQVRENNESVYVDQNGNRISSPTTQQTAASVDQNKDNTTIDINEQESLTGQTVTEVTGYKKQSLKEYYRHKFGTNRLIFFSVYLVVVLVLIIYNMSHWTAAITTVGGDYNKYNFELHVSLVGVLGIILVISAFIGMVFSQSVCFLLLGIYIELNAVFTVYLALVYANDRFFLIFLFTLIVSSFVSGPSFKAFQRAKFIRKNYREIFDY